MVDERYYVGELKSWIENLPRVKQYRDEYNNWCYGTSNQRHIVHLHPYNTHADIEVNDSDDFKEFLNKYDVRAHEWNRNKWLIADLVDEEMFQAAKTIIRSVYEKDH